MMMKKARAEQGVAGQSSQSVSVEAIYGTGTYVSTCVLFDAERAV